MNVSSRLSAGQVREVETHQRGGFIRRKNQVAVPVPAGENGLHLTSPSHVCDKGSTARGNDHQFNRTRRAQWRRCYQWRPRSQRIVAHGEIGKRCGIRRRSISGADRCGAVEELHTRDRTGRCMSVTHSR